LIYMAEKHLPLHFMTLTPLPSSISNLSRLAP
jgi:hypothetical protein